jgi:hypothetical protein
MVVCAGNSGITVTNETNNLAVNVSVADATNRWSPSVYVPPLS